MKLGVLTLLFGDKPIEETLITFVPRIEAVEFGAGAYVTSGHFCTEQLLADESGLSTKKAVAQRNLIISALSYHGNPLHPNPKVSGAHHSAYVNTCKLARKLEIDQVNTLSGCPN